MNASKIKILGITPYEAMKNIMQKLAMDRQDIELDVYTEDLLIGVEQIKYSLLNQYDVIICCNGTAALIEQITCIPVVELSFSVLDILKALKLAEGYPGQYALLGFENTVGHGALLCELLQYNIKIVTLKNPNELKPALLKLRQDGVSMVICDAIIHPFAKEVELNTILITFGSGEISSSFDQAVKLGLYFRHQGQENRFYKDILKKDNHDTVVMDLSGSVFFSTLNPEPESDVLAILRSKLSEISGNSSYKYFHNADNMLYSINAHMIPFGQKKYCVYYFTKTKNTVATNKHGIRFTTRKEAEELYFNSFYGINDTMEDLKDSIMQISQSLFPVMITGETGTGKKEIANIIYFRGPFKNNPLITIDLSLLNAKSWEYLTNHDNSPLNDNNNTIYFKNLESLPTEAWNKLISIIADINLAKRNRLIFSCIHTEGSPLPEVSQEFIKRLFCVSVCLPPLRSRTDEIPALSSLYINTLNLELGKQITGLEPHALELLSQYAWPDNYAQFKRFINELAVLTSSSYISSHSVVALLNKEQNQFLAQMSPALNKPAFNLEQPLDKITYDIIKAVLEQTNGNQSAAAKRLHISRSTLWRYLNRK